MRVNPLPLDRVGFTSSYWQTAQSADPDSTLSVCRCRVLRSSADQRQADKPGQAAATGAGSYHWVSSTRG